jgi:CO/xanthine dehydrogenase Mo-binding subunit
MDELAVAADIDPVEFRLRHLEDQRARDVIEAAAEKAGWEPGQGGDGFGRGIGFAQYKNIKAYAAVVMDVEVDASTGEIRLVRAVVAGDSGQLVSPDGVDAQLVGGVIQSASWTLHEQVNFDGTRITSTDWDSYPILTFANIPEVETVLINRPGMPYLGTGEATQGPTPAAIANAVFNATGVRLREVPFTPERVKAALG